MSGRPHISPLIAKTEDHKVFIRPADKVIALSLPEIIGKSGSEFFYENFISGLKSLIADNPELRAEIERRLAAEGLEMPIYLKGG